MTYISLLPGDEFEILEAKRMFIHYAEWLAEDICFQGFQEEIESLPGKYAPPEGCLILAMHEDKAIGSCALRPLEAGDSELKRLWVEPEFQGQGAGRILTQMCIDHAQSQGYQTIKLDTLDRLLPAIKLYESFGFRKVDPYYENPLSGVVYMQLDLD